MLFIFWIARPGAEIRATVWNAVRTSSLRTLPLRGDRARRSCRCLYLYVNSAVLMATAEIGFRDVTGANSFIAGSVMLVAAAPDRHRGSLRGSRRLLAFELLVLVVLGASVMTDHAASRVEGRAAADHPHRSPRSSHRILDRRPAFPVARPLCQARQPTQWYLTQRFSRLALISVACWC